VGICSAKKKGILILQGGSGSNHDDHEGHTIASNTTGAAGWIDYGTGKYCRGLDVGEIPKLADDYDLCTTGKALAAVSSSYPDVRKVLEHFVVYARMTPDEKEGVITSLKDQKRVCLMCGDGANDVGALKQADVGVALLSGFGDMNVDRGGSKAKEEQEPATAIITKQQVNLPPISAMSFHYHRPYALHLAPPY